ncbi:MAG TPA: hypothetical protein VHW05_05220 [Phenylobacterium sp.]|jgi:hypothetical protein|nr:hypothetical protein [Phenylobacterium sp.]
MLKRSLPILAAMIAVLPLMGCVAAEMVAAPVVAPVMIAGDLYSGRRAGRTPDWRTPKLDALKAPGRYRVFTASKPATAAGQLTINPDRSMAWNGFDCTLTGTARPDLTRQAPGGWRPGEVYQVTSAIGGCSPAAGGLVYLQARLHLGPGVSAQDFPFGNHLTLSLWSARCCGMGMISIDYPAWPDFTRVEAYAG